MQAARTVAQTGLVVEPFGSPSLRLITRPTAARAGRRCLDAGEPRVVDRFDRFARDDVARWAGGVDAAAATDQRVLDAGNDLFDVVRDEDRRSAMSRMSSCSRSFEPRQKPLANARVHAAHGSSSTSSSGLAMRARAMSTCCRSPCERTPNGFSASDLATQSRELGGRVGEVGVRRPELGKPLETQSARAGR